MTVKTSVPRSASPSSNSRSIASATKPLPVGSTFHAALTASTVDRAVRGALRLAFAPRPESGKATRLVQNVLVRAWAWLHTKYAQSATKRLRVVETVTLGEKRFVSIVSVEGREFLIGGGTSGVALLAALGSAQELASIGLKSVRGDVA